MYICTRRIALLVSVMGLVVELVAAATVSAQTTRVSTAGDGTAGNAASGPATAISGDGRYVAFASAATNLVAGDSNGSIDVFVKDRQSGAIVRVSVTSSGEERSGDSGVGGVDISADGQVIVFTSRAALVADDANTCDANTVAGAGPSCADIYVHERASGQTRRVSVPAAGEANGPSVDPSISADGHTVVFTADATNLVANDTNGVSDIFLRDLTGSMTTRVSVTSAGAQVSAASTNSVVSGDGAIVAFVSKATALDAAADPVACREIAVSCGRAYVHVRATGAVTRVPAPQTFGIIGTPSPGDIVDVNISTDGRSVAESFLYPYTKLQRTLVAVYDRQSGRLEPALFTLPGGSLPGGLVALSADGRHVVAEGGTVFLQIQNYATAFDRATRLTDFVPASPASSVSPTTPIVNVDVSADGRFVVFSSDNASLVPEDTDHVADVYVFDRDRDGDGMFSAWETAFGLDPTSAADAALDPDADGATNLSEYQANTHPFGTFTRYFAEGSQNAFFSTSIALLNPGLDSARVQVRALASDGTTVSTIVPLDGEKQFTVNGDTLAPNQDFSVVVESDRPIVADRRMTWGDFPGIGSHEETAIESPSPVWFLAEGATHGTFDLFYLLQNPGADDAHVTIDYLRPAPAPPVTKSYVVAPRSRRTIWVDAEGLALEATDVSAKITADRPIIVERSMYASPDGVPFVAGHNGAGVTAPALHWFLAEGATGDFFDLYVLIANPGDTDATLSVSYLLPAGAPIVKQYTVAAHSRRTISVEGEDPRLANTSVSTIVQSTNAQPVVVERAMWWPYSQWYESHLSAGATTTGTRWAFADGQHGDYHLTPAADSETYVLIANTSDQAGTATVRTYPAFGSSSEITVALPPNSRVNVRSADLFFDDAVRTFGVVVESSGPQIVVEHATYISANGKIWTSGFSALATKLQ